VNLFTGLNKNDLISIPHDCSLGIVFSSFLYSCQGAFRLAPGIRPTVRTLKTIQR